MSRPTLPNAAPFDHFLSQLWTGAGGDAAWLAKVQATGDQRMPSAFHATDFAAAAVGTAGLALAEWQAARSGRSMDAASSVTVDRRLASLWFTVSVDPIGWDLPPSWDAVAGDYRTNDGWIRLHTNAAHHRAAAMAVLGVTDTAGDPADRAKVAAAVATWSADDLETAVVERGGCAATLRSVAQWAAHPQGQAVAKEPLLHWHEHARQDLMQQDAARSHAAEPGHAHGGATRSLPEHDPARPLAGVRVLDLTRVLAGPIATRFLAAYGAEVLRLDPPWWKEPTHEPDVTPGKRCARLDLSDPAGRERFKELLSQADVLVHGYRSDALTHLGFDAATRARLCPGLIDVSLDAYGWTGPWQHRRGFDSLVQMSSGIAHAGMIAAGAEKPVPLPMQALDHGTGYLMAAAVLRGLTTRLQTGHGAEIHASLARTAKLLVDATVANDVLDGVSDGVSHAVSGGVAAPAASAAFAERSTADLNPAHIDTVWGPLQRLHAPVVVDGAPMAWDTAPVPLGSSDAVWRE
ncbi:CoA transferase [Pigmentiphaga litoralis]|uniref:Crotonobetainyl-CoA:carnitine CoA-transferase CaiB-like acyl-CoA transferase n=1 Tax=Pigmentiphaga litoralis TaxID=516702 RepID=A0A7Y9LM80_9BURK|nr:CoA transferase [Pigmentiphaga litoralis]NYE25010.1 crotonobetainyl-CoA:carnitine CoA-transferase CaiB-like acyl-CoA transferase [Pigmentiphaga litoralis]NYE81376.1 crotonobetainyl-CoA:carnitine CoA-transferase CaiB-like acyl-CoA transferase [Pigmentiphaga litoralis]